MTKPRVEVRPRFRIMVDGEIAIGPGKAELLKAIRDTGSIRKAAERLDMSYMRAWKLIQTANDCFKEPLVVALRGGNRKGGAALTKTGERVLSLYQKLEKHSLRSTRL